MTVLPNFDDRHHRAFGRERVIAGGLLIAGVGTRYVADVSVARVVGVDGFGAYVIAVTVATLASIAAALGFPDAITGRVAALLEADHIAVARAYVRFTRRITLGACLILGAFVGAGTAALVEPLKMHDAVQIAFFVPALGLVNLQRQLLAALQESRTALAISATLPAAAAIAVIAGELFLGGLSSSEALFILMSAYWAGAAVQANVVRRKLRRHDHAIEPTGPYRRDWIRSGLAAHANALGTYALGQVDVVAVAFFATAADTGIYGACSRIALLVTLFMNASMTVDGPRLAADYAADRIDDVRARLRHSAVFSGVVGVLFFLVLAGTGREVLQAFGGEFRSGFAWLLILGGGRLVNASTGAVGLFLVVTGHERAAARVSVVSLVLTAALVLVLLDRYGPVGAAVGSAVGMSVQNIWWFALTRRVVRSRAHVLRSGAPEP